jgi:general stress protein 26
MSMSGSTAALAARGMVVAGLLFVAFGTTTASAQQDKKTTPPTQAEILAAAREVMTAQQYCALVTLDDTGAPAIRTMNPFPPDEAMVVWMATNIHSRKVAQIRKDPRVSLYYANHGTAIGEVAVTGKAVLVADMAEVLKRKRAYWDQAFPGLKDIVLIKVIPERIDVVNYSKGMSNDPVTFKAVSVTFPLK